MLFAMRRASAILFFSFLFICTQGQPSVVPNEIPGKKESRPYKVLTDGKRVTIKSTKEIKHIMLWTSRGNRVIEQKEINASSFTFQVPVTDKYFFLMIGLEGGNIYTEKIGVQ